MTTTDRVAELYAALLEADPAELLTPLVEASGGALRSAAREDVVYRPSRNASVRFAAQVERDGRTAVEGWVVHAADPLPATPLVLDGPAGPVAAWRVRDDPALPGLRPALDRDSVAALLRDLGLASDGLVLKLHAYRPQRRAVVSATTPTHQLFLKVLPPEKLPALRTRHVALHGVGVPVPRALGDDERLGLLVLSPLHGRPLRASLLAEPATPPGLPAPGDVVELLEDFNEAGLDEPARSPVRQSRGHAALLRTLLPAEAGRCDDLVGRIRAACDDVPADQLRTVHGDLHDDQLLVLDGRLTGVVDVDGAGRGHPADDAANLLAHLMVLQGVAPRGAVHGWLPEMRVALVGRHEPEQLQARTAAVLVGLATWPHGRQKPDWPARTADILTLAERALVGRW